MLSSSLWIANCPNVESGKDRKRLIRRSRIENASRKARSISSGVPFTAAGSGIPQCAVIGCPGQNGQTSLAALSQTVKTKSIFGASAPANSSQDLLRSPAIEISASSSCLSASGRTVPGRMAAGAVRGEGAAALTVQDGLCQDGPGRVAGAEKQHVVVMRAFAVSLSLFRKWLSSILNRSKSPL